MQLQMIDIYLKVREYLSTSEREYCEWIIFQGEGRPSLKINVRDLGFILATEKETK